MTDTYTLDPEFRHGTLREPIRAGFGEGLVAAGEADQAVVALCADLTESTQMHLFRDRFGPRFIQVGVAEQNLITVAAGLARAGRIPFASSYAAFSPGRNWEQFKTTACLNDLPVKMVGAHAGLNVGHDGATHQMLEDIALMRALPNTVVVCPGDSREARRATVALASHPGPAYLRLARDATPVFSADDAPFEVGTAYRLREGTDISLIATGTMTAHALVAAEILADSGRSAEVIHAPTVKPLDEGTILRTAAKTGRVVTIEEAQRAGGLGGAVAELLAERLPTRMLRLGVDNRFGESGKPDELLAHFGLDSPGIANAVRQHPNFW